MHCMHKVSYTFAPSVSSVHTECTLPAINIIYSNEHTLSILCTLCTYFACILSTLCTRCKLCAHECTPVKKVCKVCTVCILCTLCTNLMYTLSTLCILYILRALQCTQVENVCKVCTMCKQCDQSVLPTNSCVSSVHLFYRFALPGLRLPPTGCWTAGHCRPLRPDCLSCEPLS